MTKNILIASQFIATEVDGKASSVSAVINSNDLSNVTFTINKKINRIFIDAKLNSNISSPTGPLEGVEQMCGGFVLIF